MMEERRERLAKAKQRYENAVQRYEGEEQRCAREIQACEEVIQQCKQKQQEYKEGMQEYREDKQRYEEEKQRLEEEKQEWEKVEGGCGEEKRRQEQIEKSWGERYQALTEMGRSLEQEYTQQSWEEKIQECEDSEWVWGERKREWEDTEQCWEKDERFWRKEKRRLEKLEQELDEEEERQLNREEGQLDVEEPQLDEEEKRRLDEEAERDLEEEEEEERQRELIVRLDQQIRTELTGRVFYDVKGFYKRYFEEKSWTNKARDIHREASAQHTEGRWNQWPEPLSEESFFAWFMNLQKTVLKGLPRAYYTSANKILRHSKTCQKLDIFLTSAGTALPDDGNYNWSGVLVVGKYNQDPNADRSATTLVRLAGYVREVIRSQPDRRFVPAFTICGSKMRLWMFDKSGVYNSKSFDIHSTPERFIRALAGYALMTGAELGFNTFVKYNGTERYITTQGIRITLEDKPIARRRAIVGQGTTCYRGKGPNARGWEYVVKFAWSSKPREGDLLKLAKERSVTDMALWFNHENININSIPDTIANLRRGMGFGQPQELSHQDSWDNDSSRESSPELLGDATCAESSRVFSKSSLGDFGSNTTHSKRPLTPKQKRKRDDIHSQDGSRKKAKLNDSYTGNGEQDAVTPDTIAEPVFDASKIYPNRIHNCVITSPVGRPLYDYHSVKEFLQALRDAIRAHRSLHNDGGILHRDISMNNIIILEKAHGVEDSKGMLIDLDQAMELDRVPTRGRIGTMHFMAIGVHLGERHTYRHDLESFFYVFLWICIRYIDKRTGEGSQKNSKESLLYQWYTGTHTQIAISKLGLMEETFEDGLTEFTTKFKDLKPLACELRSVLFPIVEGRIFTGTYDESDGMYDGMINAFTKAINSLGNGDLSSEDDDQGNEDDNESDEDDDESDEDDDQSYEDDDVSTED